VDRRPAVIVRCRDARDVAAAIRTAREHGLSLSVRGGGHDWAGRALTDGGVVVDLSVMRAVTVDLSSCTAVAQGGATSGDVAAVARASKLAPVTGTVKAVGMAGLTLAGGYGPLTGKHGLALDNLVEAEVVLADGCQVVASEQADADLYWALRGGGGTFGVVTAARYRLHPLTTVLSGLILYPVTQAPSVLARFRQLVSRAPDELTVMAGFMPAPDGAPVLFLFPTWSGDPTDGEPSVDALSRLGTPLVTQVAETAYEDALGLFDPVVVNGRHYAMRTRWLADLTPQSLSVLAEAGSSLAPFSAIAVHHFHGAPSRVPTHATAFGLRRDHFLVEILPAWEPNSSPDNGSSQRQWSQELFERLAPYALPGGYPNLLGPDEADRLADAYGPNATRLGELKRRYDPDGVFSAAIGTLPS
jgi:FAD/FMN-containing dehydrogenase